MPIRFEREKKYAIIANEIRVPYYEELKKHFSLDLDVLTLGELKDVFSSNKQEKSRFIDREIIISGYYHEGNTIAHYLNSLSNNMSIGYEIEESVEAIRPIVFNALEDEVEACIKSMHSYKNNGDVYLFNLSKKEFSFPSFAKICKDLVPPLNGHAFVVGYKKHEDEDLERILKSPRTVFVSTSLK